MREIHLREKSLESRFGSAGDLPHFLAEAPGAKLAGEIVQTALLISPVQQLLQEEEQGLSEKKDISNEVGCACGVLSPDF